MNSDKSASAIALTVLLATLALQFAFVSSDAVDAGFYDVRANHPWNRLHETLIVRRIAGGRPFGTNELDPLVWADSQHLLAGESHEQAVRMLDEFLSQDLQRLVEDPLKRAVLQHDLWGLFDWLADPNIDVLSEQRRKLRVRIAHAIRRLALSAYEIQRLPDNYAAVMASERLEPHAAKRSYLPATLLDQGGPWVQLEYETGGRIGTAHEENVATKGRSAFLLFACLPEDDSSGDILSRFNAWAEHDARQDSETRRRQGYPSFQFPAGTQLALVRRMLVIDDHGIVRPTNITERVQMRFFLQDPQLEHEQIKPQTFRLFVLNRSELLSQRFDKSLVPVGSHEKGFELGPVQTPVSGDPFESASAPLPPTVLMTSCARCHKDHGLLCLSRNNFSSLGTRPENLRLAAEQSVNPHSTANWKASQPEFRLLQEIVSQIEPFQN